MVVQRLGKIDILVNNAGGPPMGTFADFEDEDWESAFKPDVHERRALCTRGVAAHAKERWRAHHQRNFHVREAAAGKSHALQRNSSGRYRISQITSK